MKREFWAVMLTVVAIGGCGAASESVVSNTPTEEAGPGTATGSVPSTDGVEIAYSVGGSGVPTLVLIHGWMCDQSYWDQQVAVLDDLYKVVTIDLAGHGVSGADREGWPLDRFADDVAVVLDHLDLDDVILIGHSMGGPVSLDVARAQPEQVRAVVGVDTLHNADLKYDSAQWDAVLQGFDNAFATTCRGFVASMFPAGSDEVLAQRLAEDMCTGPEDVGRTLMHQFPDYDLPSALSAVSDLKVRCINSAMFPTAIDVNRAYVPDFEVTVMDGVGHFPMLEQPAVFNAALERVIHEIVGQD